MSSFQCEKCRTIIEDSPNGYVTGCEHYPRETGGFDRTASHSTGTYQEFDAPTPRTQFLAARAAGRDIDQTDYYAVLDLARQLERELAAVDSLWQEANAEVVEQARLLGMSGEREADLRGELERLKREIEALSIYKNMAEEYGLSVFEDLEALKVDALRYRWLRSADWGDIERVFWHNEPVNGPEEYAVEIDKAVDAARGEK